MKKPMPDIHCSMTERLEIAGLVAGQIAHDFNNLLTPLLAYPDLIRHEIKPNPAVNEYLSIIEKTATEMQHLTQKLLTLARRGRLGNEVFCANEVIVQVIQALQANIPHGITVKYELADNLLNIAGSRAHLYSVLENLCQNALDAMGLSGTLTIKTENVYLDAPVRSYGDVSVGEYVKITLLDTGVGIPEDMREAIFVPFFTTKSATKKRGSGLGLSIVHGIVKDYRGYVDLDSILGQGATFYLYFPVVKEAPRAETVRLLSKETECLPVVNDHLFGAGKRLVPRILLVDDEPMIRKLFGMIITSEFHEALIDQATDGVEAVEAFSKECHDLIIMDLQMPGQDGRESFFEIQRICQNHQWSPPPIIFCTGFTPSESLAEIIQNSSLHCLLRKPIKAELLLEAVRRRLQK